MSTADATGSFAAALVSAGPHPGLAPADQLFAPFIGRWLLDVAWYDEDGQVVRRLPGEWLFSWVLEGRAVQDVWITPPRGLRGGDPYEYGSSLRFHDPQLGAWRSTWIGPMQGSVRTFLAHRRGERVVLETLADARPALRWSFDDITPETFRWRNEQSVDGAWRLVQTFEARRAH